MVSPKPKEALAVDVVAEKGTARAVCANAAWASWVRPVRTVPVKSQRGTSIVVPTYKGDPVKCETQTQELLD